MQTDDIKQVTAIDRSSFNPAWPSNSYVFEINQSRVSHMVVLEEIAEPRPSTPPTTQKGCRSLFQPFARHPQASTQTYKILGYGGLWKIAEEAHVSTIAIHPDYRGRSYGEILLAGMYGKAIALDAEYIVLEVRVSNTVAQNLYRKYSFTEHDIKENYYRSDHEDAYDMRVIFDEAIISAFSDLYETLQQKQTFVDHYTDCPHPRHG